MIGDDTAVLGRLQVNLYQVSAKISDAAQILRPIVLGSRGAPPMRYPYDIRRRSATRRPKRG